jgi:hypothetical protein
VINATVSEDPTAVLDMADLITEEDMVTEDLISDAEIDFNHGISDHKMNMYCEYLINSISN